MMHDAFAFGAHLMARFFLRACCAAAANDRVFLLSGWAWHGKIIHHLLWLGTRKAFWF